MIRVYNGVYYIRLALHWNAYYVGPLYIEQRGRNRYYLKTIDTGKLNHAFTIEHVCVWSLFPLNYTTQIVSPSTVSLVKYLAWKCRTRKMNINNRA